MGKNNTMSDFYFVLPVSNCVVLLFARFTIISTHPCVTIFVILLCVGYLVYRSTHPPLRNWPPTVRLGLRWGKLSQAGDVD